MKNALTQGQIMDMLACELPRLHELFGVQRIALYGSYATGNASIHSDVDLLVELERPLGLQFVALAQYLEKRIKRKVDLVTAEDLRRGLTSPRYRHIAQEIERTLTYVHPAS